MTDQLTVGSLFSGIGGIDLGLERAGMRIAWQAEIDPWCRRVLAKHWPSVHCYEDVREIDGDAPRVDVIAGGFPCQTVSLAGKRLGQADERWLWPEFARIVRLLRPRYVFVENVPGLLAPLRARDGSGEAGGGPVIGAAPVAEVLGDLAALGYDAEWDVLGASDVGAPHLRKRVWIVAYAQGGGGRTPRPFSYAETRPDPRPDRTGAGGGVVDADGDDGRTRRAGRPDPTGTREHVAVGSLSPARDVPDAGGEGVGPRGDGVAGDGGWSAGDRPGDGRGGMERAVVPPDDGSDRAARPEPVRGAVADASRVRRGQSRVGTQSSGARGGGAERLGAVSAEGLPDADDAGRVERRRAESVPAELGAVERDGEARRPAGAVRGGDESRPARPVPDADSGGRDRVTGVEGSGTTGRGRPTPRRTEAGGADTDADSWRREELGQPQPRGIAGAPGGEPDRLRDVGRQLDTAPRGVADADGERRARGGAWPEHAGRRESRDGGADRVPDADGPRPAHVREGEARIYRRGWRDAARHGGQPGRATSGRRATESAMGERADGLPARLDGGRLGGTASDTDTSADVRGVRDSADPEAVQRAARGSGCVHASPVLRPDMHGLGLCQRHGPAVSFAEAGYEVPWAELRVVWGYGEPASASHRRELAERLSREHPDLMRELSRVPPPPCAACWLDGSWEDGLDRVAVKVPQRVDRLRGLGNAVVPQVVEWVGRRIVEDAERVG